MKITTFVLFVLLFACAGRGQTVMSPASDYLANALSRNGYLNAFYSDDQLVILHLDLNNDGTDETLVSLARDASGKDGTNWVVYKKAGTTFERVGEMVFNGKRFYLGQIDEIGHYGLINFSPAGAGEGILFAYVYDRVKLTSSEIGRVVLDRQTMELKGNEKVDAYFRERATLGEKLVEMVEAKDFKARFGVNVEPGTYHDAAMELLRQSERRSVNGTVVDSSPPVKPRAIASPEPERKIVPQKEQTEDRRTGSTSVWVAGAIALLVGLIFALRRFSRKAK